MGKQSGDSDEYESLILLHSFGNDLGNFDFDGEERIANLMTIYMIIVLERDWQISI